MHGLMREGSLAAALYSTRFGMWKTQPLHVVVAYDRLNQKVFLITAYLPDEKHFEGDFKTRRKS